MNRGYDQDAFHERVAKKVLKDRNEYREKAVSLAVSLVTGKKGYVDTDDIKEIPLNTQFYEVNTNNGYVSSPKKIKEEEDRNILIESNAPYFIITDKHIDHYALLPEEVQKHFRKNLELDSIKHDEVEIDLDQADHGGKRRRIRKSRQKRRTTKRRRR